MKTHITFSGAFYNKTSSTIEYFFSCSSTVSHRSSFFSNLLVTWEFKGNKRFSCPIYLNSISLDEDADSVEKASPLIL